MTATKDKSTLPTYMRRSVTIKRGLKAVALVPRVLTSWARPLPDFIIIGAQKCGTTSLYNYLIRHPAVVPAFNKEVHFFDLNFQKGIAWYRAHFPTSVYRSYANRLLGQDRITGESSPYYIFHPLAPQRISRAIPHVRLIALLRNPVDRAYSHYQKAARNGLEPLSFEDAIEREEKRLRRETGRMLEEENYYSFDHQKRSYLSRGIYVDQLKVWRSLFPEEQILVLRSEDFFADPATVVNRVYEYLHLPQWELMEYKKHNFASYAEMDEATKRRLIEYFAPHNQRLYEYFGVDFGWDR